MREIRIETPLYVAVIHEQGGGFKSFVLKKFRKENDENSGHMELIKTKLPTELPMLLYPGNGGSQKLPVYRADRERIIIEEGGGKQTLVMTAAVAEQLEVVGSGGITVIDPTDLSYSSMDQARRGEPVSLIGVKLHILVAGGRFDIASREAAPA